jgi:type VI secretion system Hcp family effector
VDAATPQFLQSACSGETLKTVLCEFPHRSSDAGEEIAFTVKLEGAVVSAHRIVHAGTPEGAGGAGIGLIEEIELAFQRIEWEHRPGKTLASDAWER